jgi:hypothetical protein
LDGLCGGAEGLAWRMDQTEDCQGGVGHRGKALGQAGPLGVVAVFVPPAVFDEVEAVFHLPMSANVGVKFGRRDHSRVEAGHVIPALVEEKLSRGRTHLAIGTDGDLAVGKVQTLADILGIIQVDPKPAGLAASPLFSVTSWAGRDGEALAKQVFNASRTSGWLALI